MKPPIWERQGRPKPPKIYSSDGLRYEAKYQRPSVWQARTFDCWFVFNRDFPTFADAIAYADREARR